MENETMDETRMVRPRRFAQKGYLVCAYFRMASLYGIPTEGYHVHLPCIRILFPLVQDFSG